MDSRRVAVSQKYNVSDVTVSHPDKIWWPKEGITKGDVVRYYADVEPRLRPWMKEYRELLAAAKTRGWPTF